MYDSTLSAEKLKTFAFQSGVDFIGIAPPDRFEDAPEGHRPFDLLNKVRSIIVCGVIIPKGALLCLGTLYHHTIQTLQNQLDQSAIKIVRFIEKNSNIAVSVPTHGPYNYWDEDRQYGRGDISLKHAAEAAGLGKIGKSSIFISKEHGLLTRLVCILTDLELEPDPLTDWEPCPVDCNLCINACPVSAIKPGKFCEQSLCRSEIFGKTLRGTQYENCRECLKACPQNQMNL